MDLNTVKRILCLNCGSPITTVSTESRLIAYCCKSCKSKHVLVDNRLVYLVSDKTYNVIRSLPNFGRVGRIISLEESRAMGIPDLGVPEIDVDKLKTTLDEVTCVEDFLEKF